MKTSPWQLAVASTAGLLLAISATTASAQNSSLFQRDLPSGEQNPALLQHGSWTFIPVPAPKKIELHDTVVVRVDELARVQSEGEVDRRKDALYNAVLTDWIELIGLKAVKPAPQEDGNPRIRGQLQQLYRAEAELQTRESLAFNIACSVVDIRPNGALVLEGHRQIRINHESWELSLSGLCRREDIGPDNVVLSRNVSELLIDKRERGHVRAAYRRGWFLRWFDEFHPF
jgi:flagellar L-ring protein precursor FlgH